MDWLSFSTILGMDWLSLKCYNMISYEVVTWL
jgi:hypothetical protein